jgi:hypothetical protein
VAYPIVQNSIIYAEDPGKGGSAAAGLRDSRKVDDYGRRLLPYLKNRPHLKPKTRIIDKEAENDRPEPYCEPEGDENVKLNSFKNLVLPPMKRKAESEAGGDSDPTGKK